MRNLPKDAEYWEAIAQVRALDIAIKEQKKVLENLRVQRNDKMSRVYQSPNWAVDIEPDWSEVVDV